MEIETFITHSVLDEFVLCSALNCITYCIAADCETQTSREKKCMFLFLQHHHHHYQKSWLNSCFFFIFVFYFSCATVQKIYMCVILFLLLFAIHLSSPKIQWILTICNVCWRVFHFFFFTFSTWQHNWHAVKIIQHNDICV